MMNPRITDWRRQRVWIVGASSGIGAALARALAARGARVALSARRAEALAALAADLPEALCLPCDAARPQDIAAARNRLDTTWGGIDVAIYNAGVWHPADITSLSAAAIDETLDINLRGAMHFARLVAPAMRARGQGDIAFVSSVAGYRPLPQGLIYGASKAGLSHFAGGLYIDLAPHGVGVRMINPGFVETPMTAVNRFRMPAIVSAAAAAEAIVAGYAAGAFEIHFPKRFTRVLKLLGLLPEPAYHALIRRFTARRP